MGLEWYLNMIKDELSENKIFTERLFLRPFKEKDFFDFLSLMADDVIGSYLPRGRGMTEPEVRKYFNEIMKDNITEELGMMSILKKMMIDTLDIAA